MPQEISELRARLDVVDAALVSLLEQRFALTDQIGRVKRAQGLAVRDRAREAEVVGRVARSAADESLRPELTAVYEAILAASRRRQEAL